MAAEAQATKPSPGSVSFVGLLHEAWRYQVDFWQRSLLFLDTLRERANNMLEHERAGLPPVLGFESETILDARTFERPANYALLRIIPPPGFECVDERKRPVIIIDPRAGHGPGIGGFKQDSEVGIALEEGHPVYFVSFSPDPCPGQTLEDVLYALRRFVIEVGKRHPGQGAPLLYGNCQAGWAVALLSAACPVPTGPAVLNGSPLSYWAGEAGVNPMRVLGGLVGGTWLVHLLADLGNGTFDGAWLVQNFENLNLANALWDKYANLFANIDKERERFLDFERWWNGFYSFSREESRSQTHSQSAPDLRLLRRQHHAAASGAGLDPGCLWQHGGAQGSGSAHRLPPESPCRPFGYLCFGSRGSLRAPGDPRKRG